MNRLIFALILLLCLSCEKKENRELDPDVLEDYIELNSDLELTDLIACAGGRAEGLFNNMSEPTSVFFYPISGAIDFRYFETESLADSSSFSNYKAKALPNDPMFNGYLWKFNNLSFEGERMGVVTYKTPGKLHVCTPIRLKTNVKPSELNASLVTIVENGVNPTFTWEDGQIEENVIYFQVISDAEGNLISGTYTYEKNFTFYDLSNVVLNITDASSSPMLVSGQNYIFTMMGVSEDNWVNLIIEKEFTVN